MGHRLRHCKNCGESQRSQHHRAIAAWVLPGGTSKDRMLPFAEQCAHARAFLLQLLNPMHFQASNVLITPPSKAMFGLALGHSKPAPLPSLGCSSPFHAQLVVWSELPFRNGKLQFHPYWLSSWLVPLVYAQGTACIVLLVKFTS